jgi:hypothetical protein
MKKYLIQVITNKDERKIMIVEIPEEIIDIVQKNQFNLKNKTSLQLEYEYVIWHYQTFINSTDSVGPSEWAVIPCDEVITTLLQGELL